MMIFSVIGGVLDSRSEPLFAESLPVWSRRRIASGSGKSEQRGREAVLQWRAADPDARRGWAGRFAAAFAVVFSRHA